MKAILLSVSLFSTLVFASNTKVALEGLKNKFSGKKVKVSTEKRIQVDGKDVMAPKMKIGRRVINNNFSAVDAVKKEFGGTATIFVFDSSSKDFVRISTNVLKNAQRAIGTKLARNKAYETVMKGETFCGEVDILGSMYDTCYAPIKGILNGEEGKIVGIWYVGYKK